MIFDGNRSEALKILQEYRQNKKWDLELEHDVMVAFWLAIDKLDVEMFLQLMGIDLSLRYLAVIAFKRRKERPVNFKPKKLKSGNTKDVSNISGSGVP